MKKIPKPKTLDDYFQMVYPIRVIKETDGYFAEIPDLPGCWASGKNKAEVMKAIAEAKQMWIKTQWDDGERIPLPRGK